MMTCNCSTTTVFEKLKYFKTAPSRLNMHFTLHMHKRIQPNQIYQIASLDSSKAIKLVIGGYSSIEVPKNPAPRKIYP